MTRKRLSIDDWTAAGLTALIASGPNALRAEPLARALGTTKGSFYWHFSDVPAFQDAVLKRWQSAAFAQIVDHLSATGNTEARLRAFGHALCADPSEAAIRAWGLSDAKVAAAVAQVDEERLTHLSRLLSQMGLSNPAFALSCYATAVAAPETTSATPQMAYDALIDLVLALK